ncbi:ATP-dependent DNA ligase [Pseudorhodoferax sp. Leaf265]|uniref:ATP-dependent DNA ligase n=1 Tax=Pseudorhodoferax sp. Leaf265 TaxID=1736315 RepID=UPI0006FA325F|nr:ATP-dependent DNA ligase [Pseudorhodoferax sp. Leaf265]KQP04392.1 ATP-dependent DNA ligase [Pseudorhodoferax sp. Leaf265]
MKLFARLFSELDATTSTSAKVQAMQRYFAQAQPADAAWAVYFLAGGKPRQVVRTASLRAIACEMAGIPDWLFEESYQAVGDLAETIAYVLPLDGGGSTLGLAAWIEERLLPLRGLPEPEVATRVRGYWQELDPQGRFLLIKLVGGSFRVGVSKLLVQRALAAHAGVDAKRVAQRMMGYTDTRSMPTPERFAALTHAALDEDGPHAPADPGQPYPFFLAHQLDTPLAGLPERLGPVDDWQVEWKYDGIRGQIVKRAGQVWLWSRGEELVTERFPEIVAAASALADGTVLDGEILVWPATAEQPAPFALLQQRIARKTLPRKLLADAPVAFVAYDLLELAGQDQRAQPQATRRAELERLLAGHPGLRLSPLVPGADWTALAAARAEARARAVEGLMLKRRDAAYGTGRTKQDGLWWKWKIDPMAVDAILIYAQAGHGRRASVYTDYTFAVWNRAPQDAAEAQSVLDAIARKEPAQPGALQLVAFAKAYSGLTDAEFRRVDAIVRRNTLEKFGPVRSVVPSLVFELGFEGIARSPRHKSGIAVRFPRMLRIREDKPIHEAGTLAELEVLLHAMEPTPQTTPEKALG